MFEESRQSISSESLPSIDPIPAAIRFLDAAENALCSSWGRILIERELTLNPTLSKRISDRTQFTQDLGETLTKILRNPEIRSQLIAIEQRGLVSADEFDIESILRNKQFARPLLRAELLKHGIKNQNEADILASSELIPLLKRTLNGSARELQSIVDSDALTLTEQRLRALRLPFLENNSQLLETLSKVVAPEQLLSVAQELLRIAELPKPPLETRQGKLRESVLERIQCALVRQIIVDGAATEPLSKVVNLWSRVLKRGDIELHFYSEDNLDQIVERLLTGCRSGAISLCTISCPNYSGQIESGQKGARLWKYDFLELRDGIGVVTYKGLAHIKAWAQELSAIGVKPTLLHILPSFEVADGFNSANPDSALSREQAISRLMESNRKIELLYRSHGIETQAILSEAFISDSDFAVERERLSQKLIALRESDPTLKRITANAYSAREQLYRAWVPIAEESLEQYRERIEQSVITAQLAEQVIIAEAITAAPNTFLLPCDSSWMSEILGAWKVPALFGQGRGSIGYLGD